VGRRFARLRQESRRCIREDRQSWRLRAQAEVNPSARSSTVLGKRKAAGKKVALIKCGMGGGGGGGGGGGMMGCPAAARTAGGATQLGLTEPSCKAWLSSMIGRIAHHAQLEPVRTLPVFTDFGYDNIGVRRIRTILLQYAPAEPDGATGWTTPGRYLKSAITPRRFTSQSWGNIRCPLCATWTGDRRKTW